MKLIQYFSVLFIACLTSVNATGGPVNYRSYVLYNEYAPTNPYQYLAWTLDPSLATNANTANPGLYMAKGAAGVIPARALWMFEVQADGTYRIYNVDNTYSGAAKRLDVHSDETTPFMGLIGSTNVGQVWDLYSLPDGISLQVYNKGWDKVLDINGSSVSPVNPLFMNANTGTDLLGQAWQIGDSTPTLLVTATSVVTQSTTVTPAPTIVYVGGDQATVTTTSVMYSTVTITATSIQTGAAAKKRDALTIPTPVTDTSTVSTMYITTTNTTTLGASTSLVTTGGGTNTVVVISTSLVSTTITTVLSQVTSIASPISSGGGSTAIVLGTGTAGGQTSTSTDPASTAAPVKKTTTALAAGLGAGLGVCFILLLSLGFFFFRRRQRNKAVAISQTSGDSEHRMTDLPADTKGMSSVYEAVPVQEPVVGELEGKAKLGVGTGLPTQVSELDGVFHATASPGDLDAHAAGYSTTVRHELGEY